MAPLAAHAPPDLPEFGLAYGWSCAVQVVEAPAVGLPNFVQVRGEERTRSRASAAARARRARPLRRSMRLVLCVSQQHRVYPGSAKLREGGRAQNPHRRVESLPCPGTQGA